ncbi:aminotransferase class V-fold PLP-dependent enzyme [Chitinimonas naiadis]
MKPAHFNTAGAGLVAPATMSTMLAYLQAEAMHGAYEAESLHQGQLLSVRTGLARLLGAPTVRQIALFDSGTRAWQTCVDAIADWPRGGRVWVTPYEYAGNLLALQTLCHRHDLQLEQIPTLPDGDLDIDWIAQHADDTLCLVSVVHIPSACGMVLPVERIGRILRDACPKVLYVVDACQSVGQLDIHVGRIGCDLLTAAGRKFLRGPRGTGFAAVSDNWLQRIDGHPLDLHAAEVLSLHERQLNDRSARRLELSEMHLAATIGLGQAVADAMQQDLAPGRALYRRLCEHLATRRELELLHPGTDHSGIVTFVHRRLTATEVVGQLARLGINAWAIQGAHTPLYLRAKGIERAVRLSVHCTNTSGDIDRLEFALSLLERRDVARQTEITQ